MNRLLFVGLILFFFTMFFFYTILEHFKLKDDFTILTDSQIIRADILDKEISYDTFIQERKSKGWSYYQFKTREQMYDEFLFPKKNYADNKYLIFIVPSILEEDSGITNDYPKREDLDELYTIHLRKGKKTIIPLISK